MEERRECYSHPRGPEEGAASRLKARQHSRAAPDVVGLSPDRTQHSPAPRKIQNTPQTRSWVFPSTMPALLSKHNIAEPSKCLLSIQVLCYYFLQSMILSSASNACFLTNCLFWHTLAIQPWRLCPATRFQLQIQDMPKGHPKVHWKRMCPRDIPKNTESK